MRIGQGASIELRRGITMAGKVTCIDSYTVDGTVTVAVETQTPAPEFAAQPVDGIIRIKTLNDVVYTGRPAVFSQPDIARLKTAWCCTADGTVRPIHFSLWRS